MSQVQEQKKLTTREEIKLIQARMKELQSAIPTLKSENKLTVKVGEDKKNIQVYGLQKFPFSFYLNQVLKLQTLFNSPEFKQFVEDNKKNLAEIKAE